MTLDASNVAVGVTGALYTAALGSTAPTDPDSAVDAAFVDLGYCSDDGVAEQWNDSVSDIVSWQNATTVRSTTTESTLSIGATLIENKGVVLERFHRGSTMVEVAADNFRLDVKPVVADPRMWVLDVVDGVGLYRLFVGRGEIVERGDVMYKNGEPIGYPILIRAYPDGNGNLMQKFSNRTAWSAS